MYLSQSVRLTQSREFSVVMQWHSSPVLTVAVFEEYKKLLGEP